MAFLSALFAEDARASNSCSPLPAQPPAEGETGSEAPSQNRWGSKSFQKCHSGENTAVPLDVRLGQPEGESSTRDHPIGKPSSGVVSEVPSLPPSELIVLTSDGLVGYLVNDLKGGSKVSRLPVSFSTKLFPPFCVV